MLPLLTNGIYLHQQHDGEARLVVALPGGRAQPLPDTVPLAEIHTMLDEKRCFTPKTAGHYTLLWALQYLPAAVMQSTKVGA